MTELIWDGKYKDGKKVAPVRIALPFQTIETVNESAQDRQRTLDLVAADRERAWRSRLVARSEIFAAFLATRSVCGSR